MGFKEIAYNDISTVFLNPEEFGEEHVVDGRAMNIVMDNVEIIERSKKQSEAGRIDGVFKRELLFYVSRSDFGPMPAQGRILTLDGRKYIVSDAVEEGGVYSITVGAMKS
ncbi:MAG: hypothetical protein J5947_03890 [Clostridium sp.]|nr:hypothetical protein [Clostridium sp.]